MKLRVWRGPTTIRTTEVGLVGDTSIYAGWRRQGVSRTDVSHAVVMDCSWLKYASVMECLGVTDCICKYHSHVSSTLRTLQSSTRSAPNPPDGTLLPQKIFPTHANYPHPHRTRTVTHTTSSQTHTYIRGPGPGWGVCVVTHKKHLS